MYLTLNKLSYLILSYLIFSSMRSEAEQGPISLLLSFDCLELCLDQGGKVSPKKSLVQSACSMTSRLASVTFKMASKVFIEETDKNFNFITEILCGFLGFGDLKVSIIIEN